MAFFFCGLFFCDEISSFLLFLRILLFSFCFFSSLIDTWMNNYFYSFSFFLCGIFFFLFLRFSFFNFLFFYVCFEFIFILMYFFILFWGYSPERLQSAFYMVFYTLIVSFPFLIYLIFAESDLSYSKFLFFSVFGGYWWFFIFFVFLVKLPIYGIHLWLPKAHVEAPVSGSMVLAGVLLKLGGYGFYRFSFFCESLFLYWGYLFSFGLFGGLFRCFLCLRQVDLKSFIAYSSVCHMGLFLCGIFSFSFFGLNGSVYILISHGFCSSCLFYILYVLYERFYSRSLFIIKGLGFIIPSILFFFFIFCSLNMGVPPSFSFLSEISIISGSFYLNFYFFLFFFFILLLSGFYCVFIYVICNHGFSFFDNVSYYLNSREYLIIYSHIFPLFFIVLFLESFFV